MSGRLAGFLRHAVPFALACVALYAAREYQGYLLFHSLAETFSIVVACGIFVVAWNSRGFAADSYLLFIGGASLFVGGIDLLHMLSYQGMGVFAEAKEANLATQLWIAGRGVQAVSFLAAPLFVARRLRFSVLLLVYTVGVGVLLGLIFRGHFPACFVEGEGLTAFKRMSEFAICAALLGSIGLLWVHRERFDRDVLRLLVAALAVMVASEVCFTLYSSPMGTWNFAGHYLKILAFFLIYLAIIETGLQRPYQLLFRNLASSEAAARESEERYRTLVEQSPRAILVHTGGKYVFANAAAAKLFGAADAQRLVGRDTLDLVAPEDRERIGAAVQQAYASHSSGMGQCSILRLDGQRVPVESVRAAVMYQGRPAIQVILEDITERKAVEQALLEAKRAAEEANQAKDNFLATLSHELRTPLTPVLAAASILKDDASLPEQARHDLEMMRRNVELQARLIDDLLDLTRIARGKLELSLRTVDVHELLEHAIDICRSDAYAKEIKLVPELHAEQAHVLADSSRLQQVFWNLVKNAIKFTPPGGKIWVRTSNKETGSGTGRPVVVIEVQDTGMGIEPEDLGRIFNAFEQGGRTITRRFGGLGLGLAICKAIAELHRGSIRASSLGRDKGATLTVEVCTVEAPAAQVGGAAGMPASAAGASGRPLRILLVEDHGDTAYLMSRLLERLNHAVATASSIQGAMTAAQAGGFDLVISDLGLPDGSGLDLMRQLKQMYGLRGICLSGYGTEKDIQASREAGFVQHLVKPVDFQNLRAAIQQVADIG